MVQEIDARGLACPQPVIVTKKVLDSALTGEFLTIVDNEIAKDNILKLVRNYNYPTSVQQIDGNYYINISKTELPEPVEEKSLEPTMVMMITNRSFGQGSEELGEVLMKSFMYTLVESEKIPSSIILANSGAYLSCQGSPVLEHLQSLAKRGVEILTCGTCLDYYQLKEQLAVGEISNMYTIKEYLDQADKILNI